MKAILPTFLKGNLARMPTIIEEEYKEIGMGAYLRRKFPQNFPAAWKAKSGTLATDRKNRLCELAVNFIKWETMSDEAKNITKKLYDFIAKHNDI